MDNYMESLSPTEAENLKRAIAALFRQTCILQVKVDPVTLTQRDNPHYETCVRHRQFIEDYLSILGLDLTHDPQERVFRLEGENASVERLSPNTTRIMLLVRMVYRDKILGEGLNATVTNLEELRTYGRNTNLLPQKLTMGEWKDALYVMSKHQIIEVPGAIRDVEDDTPIYIYGTINLYLSGADLTALVEEYGEGGAADETAEEGFYETADE